MNEVAYKRGIACGQQAVSHGTHVDGFVNGAAAPSRTRSLRRSPNGSVSIDAGAAPLVAKCHRRRLSLGILLAVLALIASSLGHGQERKDREFRECPDCPEMVGIPAGKFAMGSPSTEQGRFDSEGPQHEVSVPAFALGKYDVIANCF